MSKSKKTSPKKVVKKVTKAPSPKKQIKKTKTTAKPKTHKISQEDAHMITESLEIMKKLNSEIDKVQKAKNKLEADVSNLTKKVNLQEKPKQKIQTEIKKEITPVVEKFNINSIKDEIYKEVNNLFEIEFEKIKSEVNSNSKQTTKDLSKKISDVETQLISAVNSNKKIQSELSKTPHVEELTQELEKKLKSTLTNANKKAHSLFVESQKELDNLKLEIDNQKNQNSSLKTQLSSLQSSIKESKQDKSIDLSSIESKLTNLQKENTSMKKLIEKYEDVLYSRKKEEIKELDNKIKESMSKERDKTKEVLSNSQKEIQSKLQAIEKENNSLKQLVTSYQSNLLAKEAQDAKAIENKVSQTLNDTKSTLSQIQNAKRGQAEFIVDKINEIIDNVNSFEDEIKNLDKKTLKQIEVYSKDKVSELRKELVNILKEESKILREDSEKILNKILDKIQNKEQVTDKSLIKFRDDTLMNMKKQAFDIEKGFDKIKEDIAKEVLKVNDFKIKVLTEIKEDKRNLSEEIENKLVYSKNQFEESFNEHIGKFDQELKLKESEFLTKLLVVEDEKNNMIKELSDFKTEIAKLTKDYVSKLNEEFEKIKTEELNFAKEKDVFAGELDELTKARKIELEDFASQMKEQVSSVIEEEKQKFERHEETFREVFNEKIQNLTDFNKTRLEQIEKKFVDKNLKYVQNRIDEGMKEISAMEESINAKAQETLARVESLEEKEDTLAADLQSELDNINEKIEERITGEEKALNKRFLDIESDFSNFKSIVIDEVEDLIKEVNRIIDAKTEAIDNGIAKMNFAVGEVSKRLSQYDGVYKSLENQVKEIRDEVSDVRVKFDVGMPQLESMNSLVQMMSEYESGLISLIKSLKNRGIANDAIKNALSNKGHPIFYINMVLANFDEIENKKLN